MTMKTDDDLKALPHLDWRAFIDETKPLAPEDREVMDEYFAVFQPLEFEELEGKPKRLLTPICMGCGRHIGGPLGTFTWGIAHGECHCGECGWPGRSHHFVRRPDGTVIVTLRNFILMYHADNVNLPALRHRMVNRERDRNG